MHNLTNNLIGVNTIVNPEYTILFSKLGVLSPTGLLNLLMHQQMAMLDMTSVLMLPLQGLVPTVL